MPKLAVVFVTAPRGKGKEIAEALLRERVAACVNITEISSMYWWKGSIERDDEDLLIIKTTGECLDELFARIKEVHPYEVPEIVAIEPIRVYEKYDEWARSETRCSRQRENPKG